MGYSIAYMAVKVAVRASRKRLVLCALLSLCGAVARAAAPTLYGTPQSAVNTTLGASSITIALPNGGSAVSASTIYIIQTGDRASNPTFNTPTGFTALCSISADSMDEEQTFYEAFPAGATPPSSVTLTAPGWDWAGVIAVAYQGFNQTSPFDGGCQAASNSGGSTSLVGPSVTTTVADDAVIWAFFVNGDVGTNPVTVSQGTTEAQVTRAAAAGDMYMNYTDLDLASPGASGTNTLTWSQSFSGAGPSAAIAFALEPAGYTPPSEDQYGGLINVPCTNSNTTFAISLVGTSNKPLFCTPAGHALFARGPESMDPYANAGSSVKDEYGNTYDNYMTTKFTAINPYWFTQSLDQLTQYYGFNMIGAMANSYLLPVNGQSKKVPFIWPAFISNYSLNNEQGWGTGYAKPIFHLLGPTAWGGYESMGNELADYYDPNWLGMVNGVFKNDPVVNDIKNDTTDRGYIVGFMPDDSDNLHCFGAGPDFTTSPSGMNDFSCGMVALFAPPQAWATSYSCYQCNYSGTIYTDPTVYWKRQFQQNLETEYGTISALNTKWGSSYSTFDSSGVCIGSSLTVKCALSASADVIGTGNGSTLTFSYTASHTPISPYSFGVFVGGTLAGGDTGNGAPGGSTNATIIGPSISSGSVNYSSGAVSVTFTSPPASGVAITAQYVARGWLQGGTGFMDEDCDLSHSSYCGDGSANSVEFYNCSAPSCTLPSAGVQADINTYTQQIASRYSSTIKGDLESWAKSNGFTGSVLYLGPTNAGTWGAPSSRYVLQGFKGNLDAYAYAATQPYTQAELNYVQNYMGDIPLIWNVYKTSNADSELAWPGSTCNSSGTTVTCSLSFPSGTSQVFTTGTQIDTSCNYSDYNTLETYPASVGQVSGGVATVTYSLSAAPSEARATCDVYFSDKNVGGYTSEAARGQSYYNQTSGLPSAAYSDGYKPYIGLQWWGLFTDNGEKLNWGWQTIKGNSYDGSENVGSSVACQAPLGAYICGSERNPSGNMVSYGQQTHTALDNAILSLH